MQVSSTDLRMFLAVLGYDPKPTVAVLALQGGMAKVGAKGDGSLYLDLSLVKNEPDRYNDTIVVFGADDKGPVLFAAPGTTDPGAYYTRNEPHPSGAANLTFGLHRYVTGLHTGKPALRALDEVNRVWRDKDANHRFSLGEQVHVGRFGVNIHAGGSGEYVGKWSAGCINVAGGWNGPAYKEFIRLTHAQCEHHGEIGVVVWNASDLASFLNASDKTKWRPTLRPGVVGPWVVRLTRALGQPASSEWSNSLTDLVVAFQKANGLTVDAIVGPKTWAKLGV